MGFPTEVNRLKVKMESVGVVFSKDPQGNHWSATLGTEVVVADTRTLSQAVWLAARKLGETA